MTRSLHAAARPLLGALLLLGLALLLAACVPGSSPGPSGSPGVTPTPPAAIPLVPASPGPDPVSLFAWLFNPIFQTLFILLVLIDLAVNNMAIAIVVLTVLIRTAMLPITRRQMVSTKLMQMVAPEVKEIQRRFKGDRQKAYEATQQFYRERGISQFGGCLPALLSILPLIPLYTVFSQGLSNYNPQAMMEVFGFTIVDLNCSPVPMYDASGHVIPCLDPVAFGIDWSKPLVLFAVAGIGVSLLGLFAGLLTFIQSRIAMPAPGLVDAKDPNVRVQRQMAVIFPFIYVFLGGTWPAGLLLYIVASTIFSIVQQYLIVGWGGMFPIFGRYPEFARNHKPRFPVSVPEIKPRPVEPPTPKDAKDATGKSPAAKSAGGKSTTGKPANVPSTYDREASAQRTIRTTKRERDRGRRGRRR